MCSYFMCLSYYYYPEQITYTWLHIFKRGSSIIFMKVYNYPPGGGVDSGKEKAEHAALCLSMFQRDANRLFSFKLAPTPSSASVKWEDLVVPRWPGSQRQIGVSVSLCGSADWSHSPQVAGGDVFFRCACFGIRYILFRELRREEEWRVR